jgi:hypothetical protein
MDNAKKLGDVIDENLPHILTGVASIGVIATAIEASKAVLAVKEIDSDKSDDRKASEKSKTIVKKFIPTIVTGALTIACIVSSDIVHTKRYTSLLGAFVVAKSEIPKYKQKLEETVGVEKAKEIEKKVKEDVAPVAVKGFDGKGTINRTTKYHVVDLVTGFEFEASVAGLLRGETEVAKEVVRTSHCSLEQFYDTVTDCADAPEIAGRIYWSQDGRYEKDTMNLNISADVDKDGEVYLTIDYEYNTR